MPTILLVANWPSDVGFAWWLMEGYWAAIANHFSARGYRIVMAFPEVNAIPQVIADAPLEVQQTDIAALAKQPRALHGYLRREQVRYVYFSDWPTWHPAYAVMRVAGVRGIAMHDHTPGARPPISGLRRLLKQLLVHGPWSADLCIGATRYVQMRLVANGCFPEHRTRAAPNGIHPLPEGAAQDAHELFDIPRDRTLVVCTGRLSPYKRVDFMLHTLRAALDQDAAVHLLVVGDGPMRDELLQLVGDLRLEAHVTFAGRRSDIPDFLPSCDVGFHASLGEVGYSLSILEFMSARLAVLVPDDDAVCEATDPERTGLIYAGGDTDSAAAALLRLVRDPELRVRLGDEARATVAERYDVKHATAATVAAVAELFR